MTVFYLIRHAHADWTPDEHRPISIKGHEDARRVADVLGDSPITRIYSSPFQRARQTVAPLAARLGLPVFIDPELRERKLGDDPHAPDFFAAVRRAWQDPSHANPAGESNTEARWRGVAIVQRLLEQHPGEHVALSSHGNLLALVLQHYDPRIGYDFWKALTMPDIYTLTISRMSKPAISRLWQEYRRGNG